MTWCDSVTFEMARFSEVCENTGENIATRLEGLRPVDHQKSPRSIFNNTDGWHTFEIMRSQNISAQ